MPHPVSRREFLATSAALLPLAFGVSATLLRVTKAHAALRDPALESPLSEVRGPFVSGVFNGDDVTRPHDILWDRESYIRKKGGRPATFTQENVVVIGGGMAGLLSAYLLRGEKPLLIEQASSFGGNSRGERFGPTKFSLGAAYVSAPEEGGEVEKLFRELGLQGASRRETEEESRVCFAGSGLKNLWKGETGAEESAREVSRELARIYAEAYPSVPWTEGSALSKSAFETLDRTSAADWLHSQFPRLHKHVEEYFQLYCWSSLGGSLEELSAAQFLNFVAAETAGVVAFPGGNSAIAAALFGKIPPSRRLAGSIVLEVKNAGEGVEVLFEAADGALKLVRARAAVVAAPKYVARYIVSGISAAADACWKGIPYRAYVVANVMLKSPAPSAAFDSYCLNGSVPPAPTFGHQSSRAFTDFTFAGWAAHEAGTSVLTLYKPYPFEGARNLLTSDIAHNRIREELEAQLPRLLKDLGLAQNQVTGLRLTRWGHALPLARVGAASDESFSLLSAPVGRIFFANQDNYLSPAFETCFAAAQAAAEGVTSIGRR